jgi:hypothetical protein
MRKGIEEEIDLAINKKRMKERRKGKNKKKVAHGEFSLVV